MKNNIQRNWTVFFLIRSVDESFKQAKEMIDELRLLKISSRLGIILCLNIKKESVLEIDPSYQKLLKKSTNKFTTVFYRLKSMDSVDKESKNHLSFIDEKEDFDIKNEKDIIDFFMSSVLSHAECYAKKYMLFTWDHGGPFGIFIDSNNENGSTNILPLSNIDLLQKKKVEKKLVVKNDTLINLDRFLFFRQYAYLKNHIGSDKITNRFKDSFCNIESEGISTPHILTITELNNAINTAFKNKKLDVLVMMNCFTNSFDTGFELSNSVKYLVAPETLIYFNGYNYKSLFNLLSRKKNVSSVKAIKNIVSSFEKKKNYPDILSERLAKDDVAFFASSLKNYIKMGEIINEIAQKLKIEIEKDFTRIKTIRESFEIINNSELYQIIDFQLFIISLQLNMPKGWNKILLHKYRTLRKSLIISSYIGNNFRKQSPDSITSPSGFSIYFPKRSGQFNLLFKRIFQDESSDLSSLFIKKFSWDNFINRYFEIFEEKSNS